MNDSGRLLHHLANSSVQIVLRQIVCEREREREREREWAFCPSQPTTTITQAGRADQALNANFMTFPPTRGRSTQSLLFCIPRRRREREMAQTTAGISAHLDSRSSYPKSECSVWGLKIHMALNNNLGV